MKHLQPRSLKQLLQNVELVAEISSENNDDYLISGIPLRNGATIKQLESYLPHEVLADETEMRDGKPMFRWLDQLPLRIQYLINKWRTQRNTTYPEPILQAMMKFHGVEERLLKQYSTSDSELAGGIVQKMIEYAKTDKNGYSTIANTLRALLFLFAVDESEWDKLIKDFTTKANQSRKTYVYKTRFDIEHHYRELLEHQSLRSCMTYGAERLEEYHFVEVKEDSKLKRFRPNESYVFQPPIASYNDLDDVQLGLVSFMSPEELSTADQYPFIGRTLLVHKEGNGWKNYVRWYGREGFESILRDAGFKRTNLDGCKVRAFVSIKQRLSRPVYIIPYFDGEYNVCSIDLDNMQYDNEGRAFYWAEVMETDRESYDFTDYEQSEYRKHYRICQNNWIALKMYFSTECPITDIDLTADNGYWNSAIGAYTIKKMQGLTLDGLRLDLIAKKQKELQDLEGLIATLERKKEKEFEQLYLELSRADYERLPAMTTEQQREFTKLIRLHELYKDDLGAVGMGLALTINTLYYIDLKSLPTDSEEQKQYPLAVYILENVLNHVEKYSANSTARTNFVLDRYRYQLATVKNLFDN